MRVTYLIINSYSMTACLGEGDWKSLKIIVYGRQVSDNADTAKEESLPMFPIKKTYQSKEAGFNIMRAI